MTIEKFIETVKGFKIPSLNENEIKIVTPTKMIVINQRERFVKVGTFKQGYVAGSLEYVLEKISKEF